MCLYINFLGRCFVILYVEMDKDIEYRFQYFYMYMYLFNIWFGLRKMLDILL